jgi:hypothetical protein
MVMMSFEDENGNTWTVAKLGSSLEVKGNRGSKETLQDIAKSCARKLGVTHTNSGVPLEFINEHRRIWNTIWHQGQLVPESQTSPEQPNLNASKLRQRVLH